MNEAQRRILQMLQDGTITAEEAERLLEAVRDDKPKASRASSQGPTWDPTAWMRAEPGVDEEEAIFGRRQRAYRVRPGATVIVRQGFGPLTARATSGDAVEIKSDSPPMYGVRSDDNRVIITSSFAPLTILLPNAVSELDIESKAGPVNLDGLPKGLQTLRAHCHLGPLTVKLGPVTEGSYELRNHVGPIDLIVSPSAGFAIEAEGSVLNVALPLEGESESMRRARGRYGDGNARIHVRSGLGPINVRLGSDEGKECEEEYDEDRGDDPSAQQTDADDDMPFGLDDKALRRHERHSNAFSRDEGDRSGHATARLDDEPFGLDDD